MDLGWLWPIRETIRKGARTFSTAIANIEKYPDYIFGASQPQYFLWMKEHYPALWTKIVAQVKAGRIEPQGCMWVEADTNVSGGEALVRQILQGRRFFRREFGVDVRYLWLPDVFGYTGSLPQILKKAGVDYFSTQKLSWSLINPFPHQSFYWQGIDGTQVLTHMLPEETYNSSAAPRAVRKIEQNYKDSGVSSHALMVFGIGDGGGGPGEEHLERLARLKNLAGLSPVKQQWAATFLESWQADAARFATWSGELYLERHEGTLTTEARNKWYNRKLELALRELEWTSVLAATLTGMSYPAARLTADLARSAPLPVPRHPARLLHQARLRREPGALCRAAPADDGADRGERCTALPRRSTPAAWRSPCSCRTPCRGSGRSGCRHAAGGCAPRSRRWAIAWWMQPPARRSAVAGPLRHAVQPGKRPAARHVCRRRQHRLDLRQARPPRGHRAGRAGQPAGGLRRSGGRVGLPDGLCRADAAAHGARLGDPAHRRATRRSWSRSTRIGHSELRQEIVLTAGSPRLDFVSRLHWREPKTMLRTSFPVAIHADEATFDIQYGHIRRTTHRNTTWDLARDEVAAHKWADLSQGDYGVALLNDSKYGHKVKGNVLDLNLLRSVPYPGPRLVQDADVTPGEPHHAYTDQADHVFTYALLPARGESHRGRRDPGRLRAERAAARHSREGSAAATGRSLPPSWRWMPRT